MKKFRLLLILCLAVACVVTISCFPVSAKRPDDASPLVLVQPCPVCNGAIPDRTRTESRVEVSRIFPSGHKHYVKCIYDIYTCSRCGYELWIEVFRDTEEHCETYPHCTG